MENIDITIGQATVPWAFESHSLGLDEGWALPGGQRTTERARAILAAARMNAYMMGIVFLPALTHN
jgi:hypothetical protein